MSTACPVCLQLQCTASKIIVKPLCFLIFSSFCSIITSFFLIISVATSMVSDLWHGLYVYCCFQDHAEINSTILRSQTNTARVEGLRPGTVYVVQVRARTVAGFGKYSSKMCFQTLTDGKDCRARTNSPRCLPLFFPLCLVVFSLHTHTYAHPFLTLLCLFKFVAALFIVRWDGAETECVMALLFLRKN